MSGILWDIDVKAADGRMVFKQFPVEVDADLRDEGFGPYPVFYAIYAGGVDLLADEEPCDAHGTSLFAELKMYCLRELRDDDEFFSALCAFRGVYQTGSPMDPATQWKVGRVT